jgi:hypothetical protein
VRSSRGRPPSAPRRAREHRRRALAIRTIARYRYGMRARPHRSIFVGLAFVLCAIGLVAALVVAGPGMLAVIPVFTCALILIIAFRVPGELIPAASPSAFRRPSSRSPPLD